MASRSKSAFKTFLALELLVFGGSFAGFVLLRRNESARRKTYENLPYLAKLYYTTEDLMSGGQLVGKKIQHRDMNRWYGDANEFAPPEVD